jgi:hypothetical protein
MNRLIHTQNARNLLLTCARVVVIVGSSSAQVWAQVEPVPKSLSPLPEARFFDTRPTVGAPLAPQYRMNRQPAEADASQPGRQMPAATGEASQTAPAVKGTTKAPMSDGGKAKPSTDCVKSSGESEPNCV